MSAEMLHKGNVDAGSVHAGHRQLEGERFVEAGAVVLLRHLRLLRLDHPVLDHQAHLHVRVCMGTQEAYLLHFKGSVGGWVTRK